MGLQYRQRICTGQRSHLNVSLHGISQSLKLSDRITYNTRHGFTIRLGKGFTFRLGKIL